MARSKRASVSPSSIGCVCFGSAARSYSLCPPRGSLPFCAGTGIRNVGQPFVNGNGGASYACLSCSTGRRLSIAVGIIVYWCIWTASSTRARM